MSERRARRVTVNHHLFTQTGVDSGSLTMLGAVIHRFPEVGEYLGVAEREGKTRSFRLTVDEASAAMQVNVDLATLKPALARDSECKCGDGEAEPIHRYVVSPAGYVLFHVSRGPGGYAVRVGRLVEQDEPVFDSAKLEGDDLFAVTLIRPGTYSVRNLITSASGEIVVPYPEGGRAHRPSEPVEIECTENAIRPARIRIQAAQGQVYRFRTPSRIAIELMAPDDGPEAGRPTPGPRRTVKPVRGPRA